MTQPVTDQSLLRDAEILLAEINAIYSGQQFERNPTALINSKALALRGRIRAHVLDQQVQLSKEIIAEIISEEDASRLIAADLNSEIAL